MATLLQRLEVLREASGLLQSRRNEWRRCMVLSQSAYGSGRCFLSSPSPHAHIRFSSRAHTLRLLDSLTSTQAAQVSLYIDALLDWNQRMNLTAVTERSSIMERHIEDSLALLPVMETMFARYNETIGHERLKLVDVGSGAGLPGIVLAIARPGEALKFEVLDIKRCNFLDHVIEALSLSNVKLIRARAEDAGHDMTCRELFDISVARAVAEMRILVELCLPLVRVGGVMVAAKGANPEEEVKSAEKAARLLGGSILPIQRVTSTGPHGQRTAILCFKERGTPQKYPRKPGCIRNTWNAQSQGDGKPEVNVSSR